MSRRKAAAARAQRLSRPQGRVRPPEELVEKRDGRWWVRSLTGSSSTKPYTCPGCLRPIPPATPHVVAWPELKSLLSDDAINERRHWHTACWRRKV
ncbi:hypothetical protein D9V41_03440 [Aeromicrobium phragmitis]|uniref:ATP/GTP-binding protein n=1 Tax=Aeromicrobium phragmitis TaxID=2478914 RepID=A0A3L8PQU9_9ACTN|nr:hypothetical protein [Aeromicrobium phragmitis]RLV56838.1 hypothetical protein D9V41_03440 [Aeromicrobium phragmitis]